MLDLSNKMTYFITEKKASEVLIEDSLSPDLD